VQTTDAAEDMGIAYYGRSYKLADPNCGRMGCSFVPNQGGAPGACTNFPGVMSNREIRKLIETEKITPILNETAMVKYFTYAGDNWIGYDDADTFVMKQRFANDRCLGGIMIWSIDFDAETGGRGVDDSPSTSDDENLVWVDPEVWKDPNPSIQCFFPCTLVLPPYPASTTTTIDYPRVTVTSVDTEKQTTSTKGTITFPPITVTDYGLLTVTIPGGSTSCQTLSGSSSCTTMPPAVTKLTAEVSLSTTSTWPPVTWVDTEGGRSHTTRPTQGPKPTWPPIHVDIKLPHLTINFGKPTPTVKKCAFPALDCPPATGGPKPTNTIVVTGPAPDDTDDDPDPDSPESGDPPEDEGEGDEDSFCLLVPNNPGGGGGGGGTTTTQQAPTTTKTTAASTPTTPPKNTPNFSNDSKPKCYNSGYGADRKSMISAITSFCDQMAAAVKKANNAAIGKGFYAPDTTNLEDGKTYVVYDTSFEVMEGCEWSFSATDCGLEFRKIVDGCNTKGENGKQGGTMDGACVKWRIDPNVVET
jgi:chitinase